MINIGKKAFRNLSPEQLEEIALANHEGELCSNGAIVVYTGKYTGRSPNDKFIVDTPTIHDDIAWGKVNRPICREYYISLRDKTIEYLKDKGGARYSLVACEYLDRLNKNN